MEQGLEHSKKTGKLFVVSAPSGAGKTTLCRLMLEKFPELSYSVSHTTRPPRNGEVHGKDYFFIGKEAFEERIENNLWAEWARVHDNYYGTSLTFIRETLENGGSLLLDIDVQGAKQITKAFPSAVTLFIMAPDLGTLEQRLRGRGTESEETIQQRMKNAEKEIEQKGRYHYVIENDDLEISRKEISTIFEKELR
ncbi:MAG: guanylate kinase [Desulfobacterium sp.]|nr:guanylate kinase [Desulfobacterium sp.]